jgi:hypothetical protein
MKELTFEWDETKNRTNQRKHGVSFDEAKSVFADENGRLIHDPDHSEDENRYILLGLSANFRLLVVVHVYKKDDEIIRIISVRKATKTEIKYYTRIN